MQDLTAQNGQMVAAALSLLAVSSAALPRLNLPPPALNCAAFASLSSFYHPLSLRQPAAVTLHESAGESAPGVANLGMRVKLQKEQKTAYGFQRWWDAEWRSMQTANIKDPEKQFDKETLEMAKLMGVTPEELTKTMSRTAKVELDTGEYDKLLLSCIKAAKASDLRAMVQAREVLEKMEQVGIRPNVTSYNRVISACARAAGGRFRVCTVNDTAARSDFLDRATVIINYAGGRMDTVEFSKKWRENHPNESLALWTRPAANTSVSLSELFRASPRFIVQRGTPHLHSPNIILVKKKEKNTAKKASASSSWVTVGLGYLIYVYTYIQTHTHVYIYIHVYIYRYIYLYIHI
jgi:hypothetical protein